VVDEVTGKVRFRDYVEDDRRMAGLFEAFVRNCYRRELHGWRVKRDDIHWGLDPITPGAVQYLPKMQTDISLRAPGRTVVQGERATRAPARLISKPGDEAEREADHVAKHRGPVEVRAIPTAAMHCTTAGGGA
jgi:hypothetical protein